MKLRVGLIVFCALLCVGASVRDLADHNDGDQNSAYGTSGCGLELFLAKLEAMEYRSQKMESMQLQFQQKIEDKIQEHRTSQGQILAVLKEHQSRQEQNQQEMFAVLHKLENQVALNLSEIHNQDQKVHAKLQKLDQDVHKVHNISQQIINALVQKQSFVSSTVSYNSVVTPTKVTVPQAPTTTKTPTTTTTTARTTPKPKQPSFSSCKNVPSNVSGIYLIRVKNDSEPFEVYCEQNSFDGGWIVFQYRYDGSLDFDRGWDEYRDGFGDLNKEFWLGLEKVHQITSGRRHELVVELKDFDGTYKYARFEAFEIGSESDQYDVKAIGKYSGTARDAMSNLTDRSKFSTKDRDNDEISGHCAQSYEGAWWYSACTKSNLNGRYMNAEHHKSMYWYHFKYNRNGLSYSRMMIRELE
ncbi:fibrinogen-like protein A [Anopheles albimanus]|uniref:fibrinogen-like protein A n=1 Tax=Anopheles albimanus TaxID=7167 RepID=UPI0016407FA6|nr:fibrinogen-like protein A [Anopheles albimanus]